MTYDPTNHAVIEQFKDYFSNLGQTDKAQLSMLYAADIVFTDPMHSIIGLDALAAYFEKLNKNLIAGNFQFTNEAMQDGKAILSWEMHLVLKKPAKTITAQGISVLSYQEKITAQRDYFDAGEMFYEHVPLLGTMLRFIKKKIAAA